MKKEKIREEPYHSNIEDYFEKYKSKFSVYRNNVSEQAWCYLQGLLKSEKGKGNMERMEEEQNNLLPYHQYQHFLTNSPWCHEGILKQVGQDANEVMELEKEKSGKQTGLIIDESGHIKKGIHSVGVSRQYAGVVGKVENCQMGVYASLTNGRRSTLIDERLFLPKKWIEDETRCKKAGIPEEKIIYKTKPVPIAIGIALEIVKTAQAHKINFDWVGGDGLYGHNYDLCRGLESLDVLFVLDIHSNTQIYEEEPKIAIPPKKKGQGRKPTRLKASIDSQRVDKYRVSLEEEDWEEVKIRKTTKGWLKALVHCKEIWVWDGEEKEARKRTLIIRKTIGDKGQITDTKYSFSNGSLEDYTLKNFAFFQAQRYWVERNFYDSKNELGLSDYQVRKWKGWHHHHAIVMMAMLFMLKEQIDQEIEYPLMSLADAKKMVLVLIAQTFIAPTFPIKEEIKRMRKRHFKRKKSIKWHFKNGST